MRGEPKHKHSGGRWVSVAWLIFNLVESLLPKCWSTLGSQPMSKGVLVTATKLPKLQFRPILGHQFRSCLGRKFGMVSVGFSRGDAFAQVSRYRFTWRKSRRKDAKNGDLRLLQAVRAEVHLTRMVRAGSSLGRHEVSVEEVARTRAFLRARPHVIIDETPRDPPDSGAPWGARLVDGLFFNTGM